jgi:pilus assembly protein CpaE
MGTNVDKLNMKILEESDVVLLVTVVNLPLIRNCQRCLDLFENLEFPESKIKVLINRYLENDEITVSDVEKTLNKQIYWKIPNNYFTIMSSINKAIPVSEVNENSNITESFTLLASQMADDLFENDLKENN